MIKSSLSVFVLISIAACATVEKTVESEPKSASELVYTTGSMLPHKKNARSTNDVKTISGDALSTMPRAATPTDPLGGH